MNKEDLREFIKKASIEIDSIKFVNDCTKCGVRQNRREWNANPYFNVREMTYKDNIYSYTQICNRCNEEYSINFTKDLINEQIVLSVMEVFANYVSCTFKGSARRSYDEKYRNLKLKDETKNIF